MLLDLRDALTGQQESIFESHNREKNQAFMNALDQLNSRYGKNTVNLPCREMVKNGL
jgi:hypothetical protein